MKIAYLTPYNLQDQVNWPTSQPGLCQAAYYLAQEFSEQSINLDYLGPLEKRFSLITRLKWSFYRQFFNKDYYRWAEPIVVKNQGQQVSKKLAKLKSDIVLCPDNALPLAYLNCQQPLVLWTDSTLASLIDFYPYLSNLCTETANNIRRLEKATLQRCQLILYTSDWAAQKAQEFYHIDSSKIKVIPWGANLDFSPNEDEVRMIINSRPSSPCKLLFFGVDWQRKGGDIALKVAKKLNQLGIVTQLVVVGCKPKVKEALPDFVKVVGFVDKSQPEGKEKISQLFSEAHFLLLPSQAECYGHVFCEANSFGIPCLTTNVGGIPTIVKTNINGKTFPINTDISNYCNYIIPLMSDYKKYQELAFRAFEEYKKRLNWSVAAQAAKELFLELL